MSLLCTERNDVQPKSEADCNHVKQFHAASACAGELLGLAELFKEIEIRCPIQQWVRDKRPSVSRVDTKNKPANPFTKHLDGFHARALAKKLGLHFLGITDGGTKAMFYLGQSYLGQVYSGQVRLRNPKDLNPKP